MELTLTSSQTLLKPLLAIIGVVERKHTLPILANVLIRSETSMLEVIASDLELEICVQIPTKELLFDLAFTVNAKKLTDLLRALPEESGVRLVAMDNRLVVHAGRSRYQLQTLPALDYPRVAIGISTSAPITLTQKALKGLLHNAEFAMANQDIRFYLNGLLLILGAHQIIGVATDGHRLAYTSSTIQLDQPQQELIIPRKTVLELSRLLGDSEELVTIHFLGNQIRFVFNNITLVSKIIDGKFPDFQKVIPSEQTKQFTISRQLLLQTLQRAAILANEKFRGVRFILTHQSLKIVCANTEQEEAEEELFLDYQGEPLDIGFNIAYLLDVLNHLNDPELIFSFGDATSSVLITLPNREDFKYVVMPMRI